MLTKDKLDLYSICSFLKFNYFKVMMLYTALQQLQIDTEFPGDSLGSYKVQLFILFKHSCVESLICFCMLRHNKLFKAFERQ